MEKFSRILLGISHAIFMVMAFLVTTGCATGVRPPYSSDTVFWVVSGSLAAIGAFCSVYSLNILFRTSLWVSLLRLIVTGILVAPGVLVILAL